MLHLNPVFIVFFTILTFNAQADWVTPSERVQEGISLRSGPSSKSDYLGQLKLGERLEHLSSVPYWYKVRQANGQPAFVNKA